MGKNNEIIIVDKPRDILSININLPFWTILNDPKDIDDAIRLGFDYPYITDKDPFGRKVEKGIAFLYSKDKRRYSERKNTLRYLKEGGRNKRGKFCLLKFKFSKEVYDYLWNLVNNYEKEISGKLYVTGPDDNLVWKIETNKDYYIGKDEEVDVEEDRITFHTHPKITYKKYDILTGWPSREDYHHIFRALTSDNKLRRTIFHLVISLEGIWIVSINPEIGDITSSFPSFTQIKKDINSRIGSFFEKGDRHTIEEYLNRMNHSFFQVQLINWDDPKIYEIFYLPSDEYGNCIPYS